MANDFKDVNNWFYKPDSNLLNRGSKAGSSEPVKDALDSLEEKTKYFAKDMTIEEMKEYVKRHTSGVKLETILTSGGGGRIATFEKFVEMVQQGYNIVRANVINYDMIEVEYQIKLINKNKMGGR